MTNNPSQAEIVKRYSLLLVPGIARLQGHFIWPSVGDVPCKSKCFSAFWSSSGAPEGTTLA